MREASFAAMLGLAAVLAAGVARADGPRAPPPGAGAVVEMAPVVVTGAQPGPGLWRVSRDGHVLHILGTQSPLPGDIQWQADEVRQVLAEAGAVLQAPEVGVKADVGLLRGLVLVPAAYRAMRNPGGRSLQQVLPPDLYARWSRLKARYLGRERGIGKRRPAIAAYQLYRAAREEHGLRADGDRVVWPLIASVVDTRGLQPVATGVEIKVEDPRRALAEFRAEPLWPQDLECFRRTLDLVEHQLPQAVRRANAWATGDIAALRAMPDDGGQASACLAAWMASDTARRRAGRHRGTGARALGGGGAGGAGGTSGLLRRAADRPPAARPARLHRGAAGARLPGAGAGRGGRGNRGGGGRRAAGSGAALAAVAGFRRRPRGAGWRRPAGANA